MIKVGVDVNLKGGFYILIMVVYENGYFFIFEELLNVGVDVNI